MNLKDNQAFVGAKLPTFPLRRARRLSLPRAFPELPELLAPLLVSVSCFELAAHSQHLGHLDVRRKIETGAVVGGAALPVPHAQKPGVGVVSSVDGGVCRCNPSGV